MSDVSYMRAVIARERRRERRRARAGVAAVAVAVGVAGFAVGSARDPARCTTPAAVVEVRLPTARYPHVLEHARRAIRRGYPAVMVIHREGAAERRRRLLAHIPTRRGFDRDEYPADEGRAVVRADVAYVPSAENRGAGAVMGEQLRGLCDGTRFRYVGG
jgi:hypothetical protein